MTPLMNLKVLGFLGFQVLERKVNEMCVTDIYIVNLSKRFTFRGDKTDISLMIVIEGARNFF